MKVSRSRAFTPLADGGAGGGRAAEEGREERGRTPPSCGDGGNSGSRFARLLARSLMRGLTPQSRVHPSGAEAVKTLDFWAAERPSLLPVAQV